MEVSPEIVESYQKMYAADPNSRVFAPLSDAYRRMGLVKEALEMARDGVIKHPHLAGGRIALGRALMALSDFDEAYREIKMAAELSPESPLAYSLLGEVSLHLKRPSEALSAFKMLLFLNPKNEKAIVSVQKLESLTADEWAELATGESSGETKVPTPSPEIPPEPPKKVKIKESMERYLSLADTLIQRGELDRAVSALHDAENQFGVHTEITRRLSDIHRRTTEPLATTGSLHEIEAPPSLELAEIDRKIELLQNLLLSIRQHAAGRFTSK